MNSLLQFLIEHGVMLACGATVLLCVGVAMMLAQRAPINRQRAGEMTILAVVAWIGLACIPMPRWSLSTIWPTSQEISPYQVEQSSKSQLVPEPELVIAADPVAEAARIRETTEILRKLAELDADAAETVINPPPVPEETVSALVPEMEQANPIALAPIGVPPNLISPAIQSRAGESYTSEIIAAAFVTGGAFCLLWLMLGRILLWRVTRHAQAAPQWLVRLY